jgi:hypothetical protein
MFAAMTGLIVGMYLGYTKDDEIEDFCRQSKRAKRKMKKTYHKTMDNLMNYMELD